MTTSIGGSTGITFNDASVQNTAATGFGFKNRIINGAMVIDQRNAGAVVTPASASYTLDRWQVLASQTSKFSIQQNAGTITPPVGFSNYLGVLSASAYTLGAGDFFTLAQPIEGYNIADLNWGTANAKTVTLSFWVWSSLTGTFGGVIQNQITTSGRYYPFTYSIPVASTWTQISVTITGDTSGTWSTTNGMGIYVNFGLGVGTTYSGTAGSWSGTYTLGATGATSIVSTNAARFNITGVQLEKGSTATSFDYRPYGTELALCQRYLPAFNSSGSVAPLCNAYSNATNSAIGVILLPVSARVSPTGLTASSASHFTFSSTTGIAATSITFGSATVSSAYFTFATTGAIAGYGGFIYFNNSAGQLLFTGCEL